MSSHPAAAPRAGSFSKEAMCAGVKNLPALRSEAMDAEVMRL
jgi:hypothetical protein